MTTRKSPFTPKHATVINTLHKKLMKDGKSSTAERVFRKAVNNTYVISRKSNPHIEFSRTFKTNMLIKPSAPKKSTRKSEKGAKKKITLNSLYRETEAHTFQSLVGSKKNSGGLHLAIHDSLVTTKNSDAQRFQKRLNLYQD